MSFETFGYTLTPKVCRATLYEWVEVHPEFSDAHKIAKDAALYFWEEKGICNLETHGENEKFAANVWIFTMKARFGWRDRDAEAPPINLNFGSAAQPAQTPLKTRPKEQLMAEYREKRALADTIEPPVDDEETFVGTQGI